MENSDPNVDDNLSDQDLTMNQQPSLVDQDDYQDMDRKLVPSFEKTKGAESYSQGHYTEAAKHYSKAIMAFQFLAKDQQLLDQEEMEKVVNEIYLPCNLNLALCYIKLKQFTLGRDFANKALEVESNNIKALYRRGICYLEMKEFKVAKNDFARILELDADNVDAKQAMIKLKESHEKHKLKQKLISEKMLQSLDYPDQVKQQSPVLSIWGKIQSYISIVKDTLMCRRKKQQKQQKLN